MLGCNKLHKIKWIRNKFEQALVETAIIDAKKHIRIIDLYNLNKKQSFYKGNF